MEVGNANHTDEGKGVAGDCKSEGSRSQNPELRNTNNILRHIQSG
jgi:hypothetical protein